MVNEFVLVLKIIDLIIYIVPHKIYILRRCTYIHLNALFLMIMNRNFCREKNMCLLFIGNYFVIFLKS